MSGLQYSLVRPAVVESSLTAVAPYMFWLMFRNVASDGLVFQDPEHAGVLSQPGCVLASPSWENSATQVTQDYVYNWTRDAAVVAIELAAGPLATSQPLIDYVQFAQACQASASSLGHFDRASFLINGTSGIPGPTRATGRPCRRWPCCSCSPSSIRPRGPSRTP
jgi:glucoamylase